MKEKERVLQSRRVSRCEYRFNLSEENLVNNRSNYPGRRESEAGGGGHKELHKTFPASQPNENKRDNFISLIAPTSRLIILAWVDEPMPKASFPSDSASCLVFSSLATGNCCTGNWVAEFPASVWRHPTNWKLLPLWRTRARDNIL